MSEAIKDLLYRMADDELVLGHRNSEWTGLGPILEEDIAFSSIAQDQIGHAVANYQLLHEEFGESLPDAIAFSRGERQFHSSQFTELPIGDYAFSLIRHFLFDHAEMLRYEMLTVSSFAPLAALARKIKGELKYHVLHADLWVSKLGQGTEESRARMQTALTEAWPYALGMFEPCDYEEVLVTNGVFSGEDKLQVLWQETIVPIIERAGLVIPTAIEPKYGGRHGYHTEHLQPLLDEMTEVYRLDPAAIW
ncbi:MAG: 1,2-phenylacetyl-CoA epoxidase subunit PaaC [Bacteroidota bacterium]|nr:1,2-phenylacetyl-CoA epoxidase subunit PaaC [Bacteroidota bacterium]MDP4232064.1 1,2-phenylacetyl-CoA epoxidase subunit PaaC [Bacteroidota bacterium]MDP4241229.1 1,2-phenylacetyl-CoA epoxidase subunit PaaC [Bacteroidota bacterium]MDP4286621.1 1,2-phenylacetyl-CoA epoxidase subunit PaaC [Bacteroidota bacterium]